jgi:hypothetical protein
LILLSATGGIETENDMEDKEKCFWVRKRNERETDS